MKDSIFVFHLFKKKTQAVFKKDLELAKKRLESRSKDYLQVKGTKELCKPLGISEQEALKIEKRRDLVIAIKKVIVKNKWTNEETAIEAGVWRTVIASIVNRNIKEMSTNRLMDIAEKIGVKVKLKEIL